MVVVTRAGRLREWSQGELVVEILNLVQPEGSIIFSFINSIIFFPRCKLNYLFAFFVSNFFCFNICSPMILFWDSFFSKCVFTSLKLILANELTLPNFKLIGGQEHQL